MEFSLKDLLKRIKLPTPKSALGAILEEYLSSKGITSSCAISSLSGGTLYVRTDPATRQYLHLHKDEALRFLKERFSHQIISDLA